MSNDTVALLITAAVMGAGLLFGLLLVWMTVRQGRDWMQRLGEGIEGKVDWARGTGRFAGRAFDFAVRSRRNGPSVWQVHLAGHCPETLSITRERPRHRLFKESGLTGEIEIGIPAFDANYLLAATHAPFVRDYLESESRRVAVDALFALGYSEVEIGPEGAFARQDPWQGIDAMPERPAARTLPLLAALLDRLPLAAPLPPEQRAPAAKDYRIVLRTLFAAVAGAVLAFYGGIVYPPIDVWTTVSAAFAMSIPLLALFGRWAWRRTRGAADSHERWLGTMVIALLGAPPLCWGALLTMNGTLDAAPPQTHTLAVVDKHRTRFGDSSFYRLEVESWRHPGGTESLGVRPAAFSSTTPGRDRYRVTLGPGALGFVWKLDGHPAKP